MYTSYINQEETDMEKYKNLAGTTLEVYQVGKSFKTIRHYQATKRVPAETVVKKHRCYSAVEKIIERRGFEKC